MTPNPMITLSNISKVYANGTVALEALDLAVEKGEFVSLLGPSGCGKSTVLRLIAGLGNRTGGNIFWGQGDDRRKLAYVFQEAALMPWATVWENIYLPLKLLGMTKRAAATLVRDAIDRVNLQNFERSYPRELSGGMKMRVSIARALVTQPEILLMDEPFGALDEMTRSKLNSDLLNLWSRMHWTVVFVTHNIYEAVYLSSRVVVMADRPGRVVAEVHIDAPYPRTAEFRTSPLYNDYCRRILTILSESAQPSEIGEPLSDGVNRDKQQSNVVDSVA